MPSPKPSELKKTLTAAGLEIFRVQGSRIQLADRVRDNLIMDSGVCVVIRDDGLSVRFVTKAQAADFPTENESQLFERARSQADSAVQKGYRETETAIVPIKDPGGGTGTLDTWYEVAFERKVAEGDLVAELRYALGLEKTASA